MMATQLFKKFPVGTKGHKEIKIADNMQISKSLKKYLFLKTAPMRCLKDIVTKKINTDIPRIKPTNPVSDNSCTYVL